MTETLDVDDDARAKQLSRAIIELAMARTYTPAQLERALEHTAVTLRMMREAGAL